MLNTTQPKLSTLVGGLDFHPISLQNTDNFRFQLLTAMANAVESLPEIPELEIIQTNLMRYLTYDELAEVLQLTVRLGISLLCYD